MSCNYATSSAWYMMLDRKSEFENNPWFYVVKNEVLRKAMGGAAVLSSRQNAGV